MTEPMDCPPERRKDLCGSLATLKELRAKLQGTLLKVENEIFLRERNLRMLGNRKWGR
jgi:hypothetical protein